MTSEQAEIKQLRTNLEAVVSRIKRLETIVEYNEKMRENALRYSENLAERFRYVRELAVKLVEFLKALKLHTKGCPIGEMMAVGRDPKGAKCTCMLKDMNSRVGNIY